MQKMIEMVLVSKAHRDEQTLGSLAARSLDAGYPWFNED